MSLGRAVSRGPRGEDAAGWGSATALRPRVPGQDSPLLPQHQVPKRARPPRRSLPSEFSPAQSLACKRSASKARALVTPPGRYRLPSGTPVKQSARCRRANVPGLVLSDSPVSKLGNLLFPNLFSFSGTRSSLRSQDSKDLIQLLVHTRIPLPAQQMPAKPLIFPEKEDGAVPGAPAAARPPAEPRRAATRSPAGPSRSPSRVPGSCRPRIAPRANAAPPRAGGCCGAERCPAPTGTGRDRTGLAPCPEMPRHAGAGRRSTGSAQHQKLPEPNSVFHMPLPCRFIFSAKM